MSAVGSDQNRNRTAELQEAGLLQPQTVFVILDSAETLNLVRWVRKFWRSPTPFRHASVWLRGARCSLLALFYGTEDMSPICGAFGGHRHIKYSPDFFSVFKGRPTRLHTKAVLSSMSQFSVVFNVPVQCCVQCPSSVLCSMSQFSVVFNVSVQCLSCVVFNVLV